MTAGEECRRFYVVIGAPRELLVVGEIAAVSRELSEVGGTQTPSKKALRLHAGQYFGEEALLRQAEVGDLSSPRLALDAAKHRTHQ